MTTKEFLKVAPKIAEAGIFYNAKKGEHIHHLLGWKVFGSTERHYTIIWRRFGTLENLVSLDTAENVNAKLKEAGVIEFVAKSTRSGRFCRLHIVGNKKKD